MRECSLIIQDVALFRGLQMDVDTAIRHCVEIMESVATLGGAMTVLWHNNYRASSPEFRSYQLLLQEAARLGYGEIFVMEDRYSILYDHVPFIEAVIPAVDIIDVEYPYWHTTEDTLDKISASSLEAVGATLETWIEEYQP